MGEKKNSNTVLLTVIGVATLLVALVGATFAYFTATVSQNTANGTVDVTTSTLAALEMTSYKQDARVSNAVYPGWAGYQAIQVKATGNAGDKANYTLTLDPTVASEFNEDIKYSICKVDDTTTAINESGLATTFNYAPGTVSTQGSTTTETHYWIDGATATLPASGCTAIGSANSTLSNSDIDVASNKEIVVAGTGTYDIYYIVYKYTNNTEAAQAAQNKQFTVEPKFVVNATQNN